MDEMNEKGSKESKIISELITHINQLEAKVTSLKETISEATDLQTVNKLDIINMKNEVEKIKLVFPSVSSERIRQFQELAKGLEKIPIDELKETGKRISSLEKGLESLDKRLSSQEIPEGVAQEIENIKMQIASLPSGSKRFPEKSPLVSQLQSELNALKKELKKFTDIRATTPHVPGHRIAQLERGLSSLRQELHATKRVAAPAHPLPSKNRELERSLAGLKNDVKSLKERITGLKPVKIPENIGEIDTLFSDINTINNKLSFLEKEAKKPPTLPKPPSLQPVFIEIENLNEKLSSLKESIGKQRKQITKGEIDTLKEEVETLLPLSGIITQVQKEITTTSYRIDDFQKNIEKISQEIETMKKSSTRRTQQLASLTTALPKIRKEIKHVQKAAEKKAEQEKKEAISFVLQELKKMVS